MYLTGMSAFNVLVILHDPGLARERLRPPAEAKKWDRRLTNLANLPIFLILPLAGLDRRYGWSPAVGAIAQVAALVGLALALSLIGWAMVSNRFFSALLRIQVDRGHTVVSGGPYSCVRHPDYLGMMAIPLAASLALGSLWGMGCGAIARGVCMSCELPWRTARCTRSSLATGSTRDEFATA